MKITTKGQVTIPVEIRERLGLLPNSEVEFEVVGQAVRIAKGAASRGSGTPRKVDRPATARPRIGADEHGRDPGADPGRSLTVLVDSNVLLDVLTEDPEWSAWSEEALAECAERSSPRHQSAHLRRGLDPLRADRGARRRPPGRGLPATSPAVGGGLPRRQVLRPLPATRRRAEIPATGLLHRRACGGRWPGPADPRCDPLSHVLPGARDRRSVAGCSFVRSFSADQQGHALRFATFRGLSRHWGRPQARRTSFPSRASQVRVLPGAPADTARVEHALTV